MNIHGLVARVPAVIVRATLGALWLVCIARTASAQDPEAAAKAIEASRTAPTSTIDVGAGGVSDNSYKAGEYNGLQSSGGFLAANLDLRTRAWYDGPGKVVSRFKSTDLGLEARRLSASTGLQGRYRLTFVYDELRRNRSDSYQTPYAGTGSNVLTLASTWLVPNIASPAGNTTSARGLVKSLGGAPYLSTSAANFGALIAPTAGQTAIVDAAANADLPLFHGVNLFTKRRRYEAAALFNLNDHWGVDVNVRPEHKEGLKPMGTVSRNTGGDIATIIPDRIDTNHNQATANLNFQGSKAYAQIGYYGSFFRNNVPFMSWQNWATPTGIVNTMGSTPNNDFNQWNGSMGVNLSPKTKIVAGGSYGRMTQNDAFLTDATTPVVPVSSLNGLVVNTMLNARLTSRPSKALTLTASYKFNDRDNKTAINIYQYTDAGEAATANADFVAGANNPLGAVVAQNANANRPYSRRANLLAVDADYKLAQGQWIKGGYDFEHINRSCHGAWISCADAAVTKEHTARAEWRVISGVVTSRVIYAYAARRAPDYNENAFLALVPYANVSPASATGGATALSFMQSNNWNGYGPSLGYAATTGNMNLFFPSNNALANARYANANRISELAGMRRYYVADRNRNTLRARVNWQATDTFSLGAGADVNNDDYANSTYGVQRAKSGAINLDGTYVLAADVSLDVFYTYQRQRSVARGNTYTANNNTSTVATGQPGIVGLSGNACDGYTTLLQRNNNNKIDPCLDWSADMPERVHTTGLGLAKTIGRVSLTGNVIISRSHWDNTVTGGNWANNVLNGLGAPPTTVAAWYIAATALPTADANDAEVWLGGAFALKPKQSIRIAYSYQRMTSSDWSYEGMQIGNGTLSGVLPTNEQPFNYKVHALSASFVVSF
jgi:MtrB/PioB family decaheme-associated outer membrane protein